MAVHRYWKLQINTTGGGAPTMKSVEMRNVFGGANLAVTGSGTASASSVSGTQYASLAFDSDDGTWWTPASTPAWIAWDFGSGNEKDIGYLTILNSGYVTNNAVDCTLSYSDDGISYIASMAITNPTTINTRFSYIPNIVPIIGTAAISLPVLSEAAISGVNWQLYLPALVSSSFSGASTAIQFPRIAASVTTGGAASVALPSLATHASGHDSTGEQAADLVLPNLSAIAHSGVNTTSTLPSMTAQAAGTVTISANSATNLPSLGMSSGATASELGSADIILPAIGGKSYAGALCSVTIGKLTMQAFGTTGAAGRAQITLPLFLATADATAQNHGALNITLPSLSLNSGGSGAAITLPGMSLTAIGTVVITATYEAYAVNLKHTPRGNEQPIDEMTRYTNFPFTHVIRHQNSYYGVNSTGLYLLEGTTDDAVPIPWAVKTAMTDFKSTDKKTIATAYFGGRFGPASTVQLHAGEQTPNTYSFTTPRDQLAQNYRQVFGKGVKERYYALGASGTGVMELDNIELDVHKLTRRI